MKVADVMTKDVRSCHARESLNAAAKIMWECDCGAVPVIDDANKPIGIITDRDICMAAYTRGLPLGSIDVDSVMTKNLQVCREDDSLKEAEELMQEHQVRRLPVVDEHGHVAGILSLNDLAIRKDDKVGAKEVASTISAVSQHRPQGEARAD